MGDHEERMQPDFYFNERYAAFSHFMARYKFASRVLDVRSMILDLGCGCGYGSAYLREVDHRKVIGLDIAEEGTHFGRRRYPSSRLEFMTASGTALPLKDRSMDAVVAFEVIEHVKEAEAVVQEARRVLKPDGVFIASTPNKLITGMQGQPDNPYHVREYTPKEFVALLSSAFSEIGLYGQHLNQDCVRVEENMAAIWKNLVLLQEQVHALRSRLALDERFTGLSLLRRVKRLFVGSYGTQSVSPLDQPLLPIQPHIRGLGDWDINPYEVERAPVLVAVCH